MEDIYDYYNEGEDRWEHPYYFHDKKVDEAKEELLAFIQQNKGKVFYIKQLEVFFEKRYFHWIIANAINELIGRELRSEEKTLVGNVSVKFIFHRELRYYKREVNRMIKVIRKYSSPNIAKAVGRQGEVLFFNALTNQGFSSHGQNINQYGGKKWTETGHDLDFILEKDGIVYGCEVKNTFDYIEYEELMIKLNICQYLGIKPLLIMRFSPKTYNYEIIQRGGYVMIFETQIYPFGLDDLVEEIKRVLKLPVDCPKAIPEGIIQRFLKWHRKQVNSVNL